MLSPDEIIMHLKEDLVGYRSLLANPNIYNSEWMKNKGTVEAYTRIISMFMENGIGNKPLTK